MGVLPGERHRVGRAPRPGRQSLPGRGPACRDAAGARDEKLVGRGSDGKTTLSREEKELQLLASQTLRDLANEPGSEQPTPQVAERVRTDEPRMDANKRE